MVATHLRLNLSLTDVTIIDPIKSVQILSTSLTNHVNETRVLENGHFFFLSFFLSFFFFKDEWY